MNSFWSEELRHATSEKQFENHRVHFIAAFLSTAALLILGLPMSLAWALVPAAAITKELGECYWKTFKGKRIWLVDSWFDLIGLTAGGYLPLVVVWGIG